MPLSARLPALAPLALALSLATIGPAAAQAPARGDQPVAPLPAAKPASSALTTRSATLPARGLFQGDQLTAAARARLVDLILEVTGRDIEVALVVPAGPWNADGSGRDERDLTPARLESVRRFLAERGIDRKRIYVESRIDASLKEPRLDVQIVSRPAQAD